MEELKAKRKDMLQLPFSQIEIEIGFNVRFDYGDIDELANSIAENGVLVPLRGYKIRGEDRYIITDGHRRYAAVKRLEDRDEEYSRILIPFLVESTKQTEEDRIAGMWVFNSGKPLSILEKAFVVERLLDRGWTISDIAKKVGKSVTHIRDCKILCEAGVDLHNLIIEGKVAGTTVLEGLKSGLSVQQLLDKLYSANSDESSDSDIEDSDEEIGVKVSTDTNVSKKVSATALGVGKKHIALSKIRNLYIQFEEKVEDDPNLFSENKLKVFSELVKYLEGGDYIDLEKAFYND